MREKTVLVFTVLALMVAAFTVPIALRTASAQQAEPTVELVGSVHSPGAGYSVWKVGDVYFSNAPSLFVCCDCAGPDGIQIDAPTQPSPRVQPTAPQPTSTLAPAPTSTPEVHCNRGGGNGSEGCDPGNSGGKPGTAGEGNGG